MGLVPRAARRRPAGAGRAHGAGEGPRLSRRRGGAGLGRRARRAERVRPRSRSGGPLRRRRVRQPAAAPSRSAARAGGDPDGVPRPFPLRRGDQPPPEPAAPAPAARGAASPRAPVVGAQRGRPPRHARRRRASRWSARAAPTRSPSAPRTPGLAPVRARWPAARSSGCGWGARGCPPTRSSRGRACDRGAQTGRSSGSSSAVREATKTSRIALPSRRWDMSLRRSYSKSLCRGSRTGEYTCSKPLRRRDATT